MGKRSDFERIGRDFYPTPETGVKAAQGLFQEIAGTVDLYCEPCAGDGALIKLLEQYAGLVCAVPMDIDPQDGNGVIIRADASDMETMREARKHTKTIITNPPWAFEMLAPLLDTWLALDFECWLLLSSDFANNAQSSRYMVHCSDMVPCGRHKWIPESKWSGKDNAIWYRFQAEYTDTKFHPRIRDIREQLEIETLLRDGF